jgi:hypothetical protein
MVELKFRWWVWLLLIFVIMMIARGPAVVGSAGGSVARAAYNGAGAADKGLHGVETCGRACRP